MASAPYDPYANVPVAQPVADPAVPSDFESGAPSQNLGLAVLKRWPWLLVGVAAGVVIGMLYHTQRAPIYSSSAQLLVIKNRPEMIQQGTGNSAMAMVEDYVTTQVTLLTSQSILSLAANRLPDAQLQIKPPVSEKDRADFMKARFAVIREREPGSAQFTNVLQLTFRSGNPGDSAVYLRTIIDAYRAQLATIYVEAANAEVATLDKKIKSNNDDINQIRNGKGGIVELTTEIEQISSEELPTLKNRLTVYITDREDAAKRMGIIEFQLNAINSVGKNRGDRLNMLRSFGQQIQERSITTLESKNPEDVLFSFRLQRKELANKYGKDHPEMQAIDSRIRMLEDLVRQNKPDDRLQLDELDIYKMFITQEYETRKKQFEIAFQNQTAAEQKIKSMAKFAAQREALQARDRDLTKETGELITRRNQTLGTLNAGGYIVKDITPPSDGFQVSPILYQSLLLGLFLGLMVGAGLALSMELTDRSFRSPAEIRRRLGLPILGHIPRLKVDDPVERPSAAGLETSLVTFYRPSSTEAEAYRGVRTQLYFSTQGRGHQVIQVTSPNPGDGKSTLAANLAISIAQSGKRVVLMDCDFRKPRVHKIFKLDKPEVGLATVMSGEAELGAAVQSCEIENLSLMPCGPRPANPAELLTAPKYQDVLKQLRERFDFVIVDTPPILAVSDPSAVAPRVDGVVLVFRMTKNARPVAERAREQLAAVGATVLGVVVNASSARSGGYGGYGYAYQYEYQYAESYADAEQ